MKNIKKDYNKMGEGLEASYSQDPYPKLCDLGMRHSYNYKNFFQEARESRPASAPQHRDTTQEGTEASQNISFARGQRELFFQESQRGLKQEIEHDS